jgi:DNA repair exonuclease SbcCD ATPase subunit
VHRQHSIDPYPHIPGVIARLQKQALISASRAESASALRQVADERLTALVEAHKELDRLYLELSVRGQKLLELHEKLQSWPALEADLRRVAEDRQKMLEEAHSQVLKLSAELDDGKRQMQNLQSQVQERDIRLDQLQGEVLDVRKELLALRSQNLLGFLRNRSRRYLPRKKS